MYSVGDRVMYSFKGCSDPRLYGKYATIVEIIGNVIVNRVEETIALVAWEDPELIEQLDWPPNSNPISLTSFVFKLASPTKPKWVV